MKEEILNKKIADQAMRLKGEIRGLAFSADALYIREKVGEEGLKKVIAELEKVGHPIKYDKVQRFNFYPTGLRAISLLAMKKVFGWGDKEFRELGSFAPADTILVRMYLRLSRPAANIVKLAPRIFREYVTEGEFSVPDYDEEKKYAVMEIKGFDIHPYFCRVVEGFLETLVKMVWGSGEAECREMRCTFKGGDRHQFKATWK